MLSWLLAPYAEPAASSCAELAASWQSNPIKQERAELKTACQLGPAPMPCLRHTWIPRCLFPSWTVTVMLRSLFYSRHRRRKILQHTHTA